MTSSREQLKPVGNLTPGKVSDILWESAIEAFVQAILVLVMGSVALSIVGGLLQDMIPSIPPGFAGTLGVEAESSPNSHQWWSALRDRKSVV